MYYIGSDLINDNVSGFDSDDIIDGAGGNDFLAGYGGQDFLYGGAGDDWLLGGNGDDFLYGEDGDDVLDGGDGADYLDGGDGYDTASYAHASSGIYIDLATGETGGAAAGDVLISIEAIENSAADDTILGDATKNVFIDNAGNDYLDGRDGVDSYRAYDAYDPGSGMPIGIEIAFGSRAIELAGNLGVSLPDPMAGVAVRTVWDGSAWVTETDVLVSIEELVGSSGDDVITGSDDANFIEGGDGNDTLDGGGGFDHVSYRSAGAAVTVDLALGQGSVLGADTDVLRNFEAVQGSINDDGLYGDADANRLEGGDGNDVLSGRGGDDHLVGNDGNDVLQGDAGNDLLDGGLGADLLNGGEGIDTATYAGSAVGVYVDLQAGKGSVLDDGGTLQLGGDSEGDRLISIENLIGSQYGDTLWGNSGANRIEGSGGDDELYGGAGDDVIYGGDAPDQVIGLPGWEAGNGSADPLCGADSVAGSLAANSGTGAGISDFDYLDGGDGNDLLYGQEGSDMLLGGAGNDSLFGGDQVDLLLGGAGNDVLEGGAGFDVLVGGDGFDIASYSLSSQAVTVNLANPGQISGGDASSGLINELVSTVMASEDLKDTFDNTVISAALSVLNDLQAGSLLMLPDMLFSIEGITGSAFDDNLTGDAGDNRIDGGGGRDTMAGGTGNDTYVVDSIGDVVTEGVAAGVDTVESSISYTLTGNVENLKLVEGAGAINGTGNTLSNVVTGNASNNVLDGGAGIDTVSYATSTSAVSVNLSLTTAQNTGGGGTDTLLNFENLTTGIYDDTLMGTAGANVLNGGIGTDTVSYANAGAGVTVNLAVTTAQNTVGAGNDTLISIENLTGSAFNDLLAGNGFNNVINGGGGNDTMNGAAGIDTVSYADAPSAVTVSLALTAAQNTGGAGTDTLTNFENLTGSAFNDVLTGNSLNNVIIGGAGNDTMDGGSGIDTVSYADAPSAVTVSLALTAAQNTGGAGTDTLTNFENLTGSAFNDVLTGNSLNNVIIGGAGNDTMNGGSGIDTVSYADAAAAVRVNLALAGAQNTGGAGTDTLTNFENLTGSAFNDVLTGNGLNNVIIGGAGNDTMDGGAGVDTVSYVNAPSGVHVSLALTGAQNTCGAGTDTLIRFENLTGSTFADLLTGNSGANNLNGGNGNDTLTGGLGADTFTFATTLSASGNNDTITDMISGVDKIAIDDAVFTAIGGLGNFVASDARFYAASGAVSGHDADDRIIYDTATGALYYDADGNGSGAAVQFAVLGTTTHPSLAATDIVVV